MQINVRYDLNWSTSVSLMNSTIYGCVSLVMSVVHYYSRAALAEKSVRMYLSSFEGFILIDQISFFCLFPPSKNTRLLRYLVTSLKAQVFTWHHFLKTLNYLQFVNDVLIFRYIYILVFQNMWTTIKFV